MDPRTGILQKIQGTETLIKNDIECMKKKLKEEFSAMKSHISGKIKHFMSSNDAKFNNFKAQYDHLSQKYDEHFKRQRKEARRWLNELLDSRELTLEMLTEVRPAIEDYVGELLLIIHDEGIKMEDKTDVYKMDVREICIQSEKNCSKTLDETEKSFYDRIDNILDNFPSHFQQLYSDSSSVLAVQPALDNILQDYHRKKTQIILANNEQKRSLTKVLDNLLADLRKQCESKHKINKLRVIEEIKTIRAKYIVKHKQSLLKFRRELDNCKSMLMPEYNIGLDDMVATDDYLATPILPPNLKLGLEDVNHTKTTGVPEWCICP